MGKRSNDPFEDFLLSPLFAFIMFFILMVFGMALIVGFAKLTTP